MSPNELNQNYHKTSDIKNNFFAHDIFMGFFFKKKNQKKIVFFFEKNSIILNFIDFY